jgi:hypothetical protein
VETRGKNNQPRGHCLPAYVTHEGKRPASGGSQIDEELDGSTGVDLDIFLGTFPFTVIIPRAFTQGACTVGVVSWHLIDTCHGTYHALAMALATHLPWHLPRPIQSLFVQLFGCTLSGYLLADLRGTIFGGSVLLS